MKLLETNVLPFTLLSGATRRRPSGLHRFSKTLGSGLSRRCFGPGTEMGTEPLGGTKNGRWNEHVPFGNQTWMWKINEHQLFVEDFPMENIFCFFNLHVVPCLFTRCLAFPERADDLFGQMFFNIAAIFPRPKGYTCRWPKPQESDMCFCFPTFFQCFFFFFIPHLGSWGVCFDIKSQDQQNAGQFWIIFNIFEWVHTQQGISPKNKQTCCSLP